MNVLFVTIDSLRFDLLSTYRDEPAEFGYPVETKNLDRFAKKAAVFDSHYAGSLPCLPARREWLAGIQEFPWRSWAPLEPFDRPLPRLARESGAVTQLITDHYHYYQHGAQGYFEDFNGHEFIRGHEWDPWQTSPVDPDDDAFRAQLNAGDPRALDMLNRNVYSRNTEQFETEEDWFAPRVFSTAADWLRENETWDQWFCYVDSFDVHEPFDVPEPYASMYTDEDPEDSEMPVWPIYGRVEDPREDDH
jgi:arylsulfatase A-like enzyme